MQIDRLDQNPILSLWHLERYPYAGQNLAMSQSYDAPMDSPDDIASMVDGWFEEYENGTYYGGMENIRNFSDIGYG